MKLFFVRIIASKQLRVFYGWKFEFLFQGLKNLYRFGMVEEMKDLKALWSRSWANFIQYKKASIVKGILEGTLWGEVFGSGFF